MWVVRASRREWPQWRNINEFDTLEVIKESGLNVSSGRWAGMHFVLPLFPFNGWIDSSVLPIHLIRMGGCRCQRFITCKQSTERRYEICNSTTGPPSNFALFSLRLPFSDESARAPFLNTKFLTCGTLLINGLSASVSHPPALTSHPAAC